MEPVNFSDVILGQIEVNGISALYDFFRIDRKTVPKGLFAYDLRGCDDSEDFSTIEPHVLINHAGTIITAQEIPMAEGNCTKVTDYKFIESASDDEGVTEEFGFYQDQKITVWNRVRINVSLPKVSWVPLRN